MDHITEAIYNVMYQYRLAFTPDGVQANLDLWRQQKTQLLDCCAATRTGGSRSLRLCSIYPNSGSLTGPAWTKQNLKC